MNKIGAITTLAIAALGAAGVWYFLRTPDPPSAVTESASSAQMTANPRAPETPAAEPAAQAPQDRAATAPDEAEEETGKSSATFRVDAAGKLILDEATRLRVEEFFAGTLPADVQTAALDLVTELPPPAASLALDVVERYGNYQAAQDQSDSDEGPETPEQAIVLLQSLHALRIEHFGPDLAKTFYGAEEQLSRELIEVMRLERDQSLTMAEKAERTQQLRDQLPAVSAADKGKSAPADKH
jgi:hypothetical protein